MIDFKKLGVRIEGSIKDSCSRFYGGCRVYVTGYLNSTQEFVVTSTDNHSPVCIKTEDVTVCYPFDTWNGKGKEFFEKLRSEDIKDRSEGCVIPTWK